jgi:hypothetical protein
VGSTRRQRDFNTRRTGAETGVEPHRCSHWEDRRRECRSTCRTPTSSSARPARDGWPAARKRARTPRVPQGGRRARAPQRRSYTHGLIESRIVLELHAASVPHTDL